MLLWFKKEYAQTTQNTQNIRQILRILLNEQRNFVSAEGVVL